MQPMEATMSAAPTDTAEEAAPPPTVADKSTTHAKILEIMASLPRATGLGPYPLRQYGGFWLPELFLKGVATAHVYFKPRSTDVLLASFPKSGTTWLKALAFAALNRGTHPPSGADHPLRHGNPHDCVGCLEVSPKLIDSDYTATTDVYEALPSPRVLGTHLPHSLLPRSITETEECKVLYVCRDPKDTFVSFWHFHKKATATMQETAGSSSPSMPTFEEAFEMFSEGRCIAGPQWRHALEFWEASQRRPGKVLFLWYEEMLRDPAGSLKKLAAFMGCTFSREEEEAGMVRDIVELCSFEKLKGMDVNKNGLTLLGLKNESFFRKGVVGDWNNYMSPEMAARLDKVVKEALQGSTLTFCSLATPSK